MKQIFWIVIIKWIATSLVGGIIKDEKELKKYDLTKNLPELSYSYADNLNYERHDPTIFQLDNNHLIFIGGEMDRTNVDKKYTVEIYDLKTKKMYLPDDNTPIDISRNSSFKLSNGNILIFSYNGIVEFNVKTNKFILKQTFENAYYKSIEELGNGNFLVFHADFPCLDKQKPSIIKDYIYSYKNNELKILRELKYPIPDNIHCSYAYPYHGFIKPTADNKFLVIYTRYNNKNENYSRFIPEFMELFDPKTLNFIPVNYHNYANLIKEKNTYTKNTKYENAIEQLKSSAFTTTNPISISRKNDRILFIPELFYFTKRPLRYILVYRYDYKTEEITPLGYLPFHAVHFSLFKLNEHDILISGGYTYDDTMDQKIRNLEHNNVILHLK